ncbi:sensor histidine kinase [Sphingomonas nostoxanthinifaciens]|uniref:sensor histidine kinase n=1 Tax=Sphingomonas nostoxanthinifaciens TaxID=2872652 RepID=UPI001CC1FD55|nr:ATP-binding protein [Sphingomonas nostoxanthinifaciens]UAK23958.1 ATPase [Sphingomonas nostoxanthinifaciens]
MVLRRFSRLGAGPHREHRPPPNDPTDELIEAIGEPLIVLDGYHVAHANAAARALLGEHIVGDYVRLALRHPAAGPVLSGDEEGPVALSGLGGQDRLWELTAGTIRPGRRLLRLTDRSAQRAAEQMRVDFVANASHELRTPLASLIGFIETLEDANGQEDATTRLRFLSIMEGEARRMQRLIDDLMSLSRIEADRYYAPRDRIDIGPLLRELADEFRSTRRDGERLEIDAADHATVIGDRAQLHQLIHNVISNSFKYGRDGTPIVAALRVNGLQAHFSVTDQGDGIAPAHLPRLTERFYRADPSRSRAIGGTGLGLAIVKHIVERHRGRLEIVSEVGRGTTVSAHLPLAP